jgi:hypothetical protein
MNTKEYDKPVINFYKTGDPYGAFSNFSRHPFVDNKGVEWPTSEHYFQAKKFEGTPHEEQIRNAKTAGDAARMGRERNRPLRKDWEQVKEKIMMEALVYKFSQHHDINQLLLSTNGETLVEHTINDSYWGDGGDGSGKNRLGALLMELRETKMEDIN